MATSRNKTSKSWRARLSRAVWRGSGVLSPRKVSLETRPDGAFRFAVVSDTHSRPHPATKQRLIELSPDAILHAGDIGDLAVLRDLAELAPVFAVRGNIDAQVTEVPDTLVVELMREGALKLRVLLLHIALYGPKLRAEVARVAARERASLVVCGHSHVPFIGRDRGLSVFNPGSIGPRRFQLPIVLGAIEIAASTRATEAYRLRDRADVVAPGVGGAALVIPLLRRSCDARLGRWTTHRRRNQFASRTALHQRAKQA